MADEAKVTPAEEKITADGSNEPKGTVADIIDSPKDESKSTDTETVPLSVYLSLKDDVKELKKAIKDSKESNKPSVTIEGLKDLADKYPDVNQEFIQDILASATTQAAQELDKKYAPKIEKLEADTKKESFNKAFDSIFQKAVDANPDLPKNIDKEAVKSLALTPAYQNVPIAEILNKLYGGVVEKGKFSSENDTRTDVDVETITDFSKITPEQRKRIVADPTTRQKYFAYLDTQN